MNTLRRRYGRARKRGQKRMVVRPCPGRMFNGPGKNYARCSHCRAIDYEKYEGDRCGRNVEVPA